MATPEPQQVTKEMVEEALYLVIDPELGWNIMDLGLVYDIHIVGGNVQIEMTMTTPGCPMGQSITQGVERAVGGLPGVENVYVEIVWNPPWSPDKMSERARAHFGF